jgi:glycosyltransferase involved in cell wall biosynthesis
MSGILTPNAPFNLAYISPVNPIPSGLSDYSETLLPVLAEFCRITLYTDAGTPSNRLIAQKFVTRPIQSLSRYRAEHHLRLYQLGNSAQHQTAFVSFRLLPGVVTLHEPFLHTAIRAISLDVYRRELRYELGQMGILAARQFGVEIDRQRLMNFPLIGRVIDSSLGIMVHSRAARQLIERYRAARPAHWRRFDFDAPVAVIPQLMPSLFSSIPSEHRAEFGLPEDALVLGIAGLIDPTKEPELALQAFARIVAVLPQAWLIFAGDLPSWYTSLPALARSLGVDGRVMFLGRVDPIDRLHRAMAACDVIVNLRQPTIGETSATALRALALGRPLIVRNVGWYGELPDAVCVKMGASTGVEELTRAIIDLGQHPDLRQRMGEAGSQYVRRECGALEVARRYAEFLREIVARAWSEPESRKSFGSRMVNRLHRPEGDVITEADLEVILPQGKSESRMFQAQVQAEALTAMQEGRLNLGSLPSLFDER